jgi:hypothetical protein
MDGEVKFEGYSYTCNPTHLIRLKASNPRRWVSSLFKYHTHQGIKIRVYA